MKFKYKNDHGEVAIFEIKEGSSELTKQAYREDLIKLQKINSEIAKKLILSRQKSLAKPLISPPNGYREGLDIWGIVANKKILISGQYKQSQKKPEEELASSLNLTKIRLFKKNQILEYLQ